MVLLHDDFDDDLDTWATAREDDGLSPAEVFREALRDEYADVEDDEMEDALAEVLGAMSPAESFNVGYALRQIGRTAGQSLSDPFVASIARTALPVAGGALGTVIGGPVGTAAGSQLGSAAAQALPARAPVPASASRPVLPPPVAPSPPALPAAAVPPSPVADGSAAAAQGLVLTQQPQVLHGLLATALGRHGRQQVGGVPVAQLLGMLSQVFGQAAADADELLYMAGGAGGGSDESIENGDRSLYTTLIDADNLELGEAYIDGWVG